MKRILFLFITLISVSLTYPQSKGTIVKEAAKMISRKTATSGAKTITRAKFRMPPRSAIQNIKNSPSIPKGCVKPQTLPQCLSYERWKHIVANHGDEACAIRHKDEGFPLSTYFTPGFRDKLASEIPKIIKKENYLTYRPVRNKKGDIISIRYTYRKKYNEPIGYDLEGRTIYDCFVTVEEDGSVVTSYPAHKYKLQQILKKASREVPN